MKAIFGFVLKHKIVSTVVLSIATLAVGGVSIFKSIMENMTQQPEMEFASETFEYETISSLKKVFAISEDEQERDIQSYATEEGFDVYKRSFYNFISTDNYRVVTTGYIDVNVMGGIRVNIKNEKKFDGTNFYMHLNSMADKESTFSSLSNNDAMHYLYVTENNNDNLATVKILDPKDSSKLKRKTVTSEKDYVFNYGAIPYTACNYIIREHTVNEVEFSFDSDTGLYKIQMTLDPVKSTEGLIKQMHMVSGTDASYANGSVIYTAYVDGDFVLRRADVKESYQVFTMGTFNGVAESTDLFFYDGDTDFMPLTEDEKYDIRDIPVKQDDTAVAYAKSLSQSAIDKVKENGVNADFTLSVGDVNINGRIQATIGDDVKLRVDANYGDLPISLYASLNNDKSGLIIADVNGVNAGLTFDNLGKTVSSLLDSFGVSLDGVDIEALVESINVSDIINSFGGINGTCISDTTYLFEVNLNDMGLGIPMDLPFKMTVENGSVASFKIDNEEVLDTHVNFVMTPSQRAKDLTEKTAEDIAFNLSSVINYVTEKEFSFDLIQGIIESKTVSFNVDANLSSYLLTGSVAIDFNDIKSVKVLADVEIDGAKINIYYCDGEVLLNCGKISVSADVDDILDYVAIFTGKEIDLSLDSDNIWDIVKDIATTICYDKNNLSFNYEDLFVSLSHGSATVNYGEKISLTVSELQGGAEVIAPKGNYIKLEGLKALLEKINAQLNTRHFTANGSIAFGDTNVRFENIKIINEGNLKDPTEAFDNGDLTLSGTVYVTASGKTHKLYVQYVNSTLYVVYNNDMKVKLSRASLDYIVELIKDNYKAIIQRFNYSEILSADDILSQFQNYEFTIGSVVDILQAIAVDNGGISIDLKAEEFGFTDNAVLNAYLNGENLALNVTIGDKNGNILLDNTPFDKPAVPSGSFIDLSGISESLLGSIINYVTEKEFSFDLIQGIIESKTVSFNVDANLSSYLLTGSVAIDFNDIKSVKVLADVEIDGAKINIYYCDGEVLLNCGKISVSADVDDILDYVAIFTGKEIDLSLDSDNIWDIVKDIATTICYDKNNLSFNYEDLFVSLSHGSATVNYGEKISLTVSELQGGAEVIAPKGNYIKLEGLKALLEKINAQLNTRHFTANGSIAFGDTNVRFENIKIINEGNLKDPTEAFDNGDLTLSGTVYVTASGKTHKLYVQYVNSTLYVVYNNDMKVKLSRASLDYIVELIKDNYKAIIQRFNYSEILSADDILSQFQNYEFTIGSVVDILQAIAVDNGGISIDLKAEEFGFTDNAVLNAYLNGENLALNVTIGDKNGNILLDNTPFDKPAVPSGSFIDLSGITGLAEAAVNAILKESEQYYLSGSVRVVIPILGINIYVNISMDASVRLLSDGNGGKKIEAVAHVSCYDTTVDISLARSYLKCGEGTLVYKNERFYITRIDKQREKVLFIPTSSWQTTSTSRRAMTRSYFGKNIMSQIGFFMGLGNEILNKFNSGSNTNVAKCLKSYSASANSHTIVLDGQALTGSSELSNMTAVIGITNKQLTSLNVEIPISVSIVDMTATVKLTHNPADKGNFTDVNNLNPSLFGTVRS